MSKVLNFLEWIKENQIFEKIDHLTQYTKNIPLELPLKAMQVLDFYNQKFDISMLVNPTPPYTNKEFEVYKKEFAEAETKRLFEGWGKKESWYYFKKVHIFVHGSSFIFRSIYGDETTIKTLNDFITLCSLAGIELQWNTNNETLKGLNLV